MAATKTIMSIRKWAYKTFGDEAAIEFIAMASAEDLAANAEFIRYEQALVSLKLKKPVDAGVGRTFSVIIEGG